MTDERGMRSPKQKSISKKLKPRRARKSEIKWDPNRKQIRDAINEYINNGGVIKKIIPDFGRVEIGGSDADTSIIDLENSHWGKRSPYIIIVEQTANLFYSRI